jgi:hypothetical protein
VEINRGKIVEKRLGKLKNVKFGLVGYQDACLGISVNISGSGWGCGDSKSYWDKNLIKCTDNCKWTEKDRANNYADIMIYISELLKDAKVSSIDKLNGIPVEAEFDGMQLKSWRILTEVI